MIPNCGYYHSLGRDSNIMKDLLRAFLKKIIHVIYPYLENENFERGFGKVMALNRVGNDFSWGNGNIVIGPQNMILGHGCHVGRMCRFETISEYYEQRFSPILNVSDNVSFEDFCHIACAEKIEIGSGTMIASRVFITDHFHGEICVEDINKRPALRALKTNPVKIGCNVWIGEGVSIMPGVSIGNNVIIGANAVVTHSFGENLVIAGCPAKIIKDFNESL